jgi:hypothetical protein
MESKDRKWTLTDFMELEWMATYNDSDQEDPAVTAKLKEFPEFDETLAAYGGEDFWRYPICRFMVQASREEIRVLIDKLKAGIPFKDAFKFEPINKFPNMVMKPAWDVIDYGKVDHKLLLKIMGKCTETEFSDLLDSLAENQNKQSV